MGRSVSVPRNAAYAAYQALSDECDGDDFSWLVDDLRSVLKSAFPSVSESDRWAGREDRVIACNRHADFGISEYCGLVSVWVIPNEDSPLASAWVDKVEVKFRAAVAGCFGQDLRKQGVFSNGEAIFQPVDGKQQGSMGLGFSSKEGWL